MENLFILHLDINDGFRIQTTKSNSRDYLQEILNGGEDGINLEIGHAKYAVDLNELNIILSDIQEAIEQNKKG